MFEFTSRYYHIETLQLTLPDGRVVAYKRRRFCPPGEGFTILAEIAVNEGDRLDVVTARALGDPQQFWQVADANDALHPDELTAEIGRRLCVPMPQAQVPDHA